MPKIKILVSVKTYPSLSEKYAELVCTAGFREDGSWIRLYPVPFRMMDKVNQYSKWQWIEVNVVKNPKDFRPESYRPYDIEEDFALLNQIGTGNNWQERRRFALKEVWTNMSDLINASKDPQRRVSLAVLKPKEILDFYWEEVERDWDQDKLNTIVSMMQEPNLFEETKRKFVGIVKKLPYKFSYRFTTNDGIERNMMIEDWEIGALYWNTLKSAKGNEVIACQKIKEKYFDDFAHKKNLYFFVGTSLKFHNVAPNPFMIIGALPLPMEEPEPSLFDF